MLYYFKSRSHYQMFTPFFLLDFFFFLRKLKKWPLTSAMWPLQDGGFPKLAAHSEFSLRVTDENDNPPQLVPDHYLARVPEGNSIGGLSPLVYWKSYIHTYYIPCLFTWRLCGWSVVFACFIFIVFMFDKSYWYCHGLLYTIRPDIWLLAEANKVVTLVTIPIYINIFLYLKCFILGLNFFFCVGDS